MKENRLHFRTADGFAIAGALLLAVCIFMLFLPKTATEELYAQIYVDGKLVRTISLTADQEFAITNRYTNTITVRDGAIAITDSDCPSGDCLHCGWIRGTGKNIVCLPNGLEIRVVAKNSDVDFVVG